MTSRNLPIDDVMPALLEAVRARGRAVLVAAPGAGKTTRVPGALLDAGLVGDGEIVVLQPRRLAARLAASHVAQLRGGKVGDEVGYEIRFDRQVSARTKLRFVTEGILTRQLLGDGRELKNVSCVILDEFHERHLDGDLALALTRTLAARRGDLRLIVMSATLAAEPIARFLGDAAGDAPIVRSEGRTFPVAIDYLPGDDDWRLTKKVGAALRQLAAQGLDGDVLVFLPGTGEIRHCEADLAELAATHDLELLPLHGDLTASEQDRAVTPGRAGARRKVILATNVAETSITIDGVVAVIDAGTARIARHAPWSGLPTLQIEPISRASATQRAGRAGRTRPGRVIRLYDRHDFERRREFETPEVARLDLAGPALELHAAGFADLLADVAWFEPPPEAAVRSADALLARLGAIDDRGVATSLGRRMASFPVHPRLARIVCEGAARGVGREACTIAALLGARELRLERRQRGGARFSSTSDVLDDLDSFSSAKDRGLRADVLRREGLDAGTAHQVDRATEQLRRIMGRPGGAELKGAAADDALRLAILAGYPDRVGRRRAPGSTEIVLGGGGSAQLSPHSSVIDHDLMVAVDLAETGARGLASRVSISRASAIAPDWLIELFAERIEERDEIVWNRARERVERRRAMLYDGLSFDETVGTDGLRTDAAAATRLAHEAITAGLQRFVDAGELAQLRARLALVAVHAPERGLPSLSDASLAEVLGQACVGVISFAELGKLDLLSLLRGQLGEHAALLDKLAPTHLPLPGRRRAPIHYPELVDGQVTQAPWISSRMQDFFGLARAPAVVDGRVPLVLHLLAPNQRPVQVTQDLPGFWKKHYPDLRRALMRRYPRQSWPEDPSVFVSED